MRMRDLRGWETAVTRARELWPEIPGWAFELAADDEPPMGTYQESEWFSVHPSAAADVAVRLACARGWRPKRDRGESAKPPDPDGSAGVGPRSGLAPAGRGRSPR